METKQGMKVLVAFSGGKDSHASLIWAVNFYGKKLVTAVFCDTQWEHALLYPFIDDVCAKLEVELVILRSQYSFIELALKINRFPSTKAKFCTRKLKVEPMVDYVIEQGSIYKYLIVVQGIRKDESAARSTMEKNCSYFKYYFEPYGHDKHGKSRKFSYRKKEIVALDLGSRVDIERPVFDKTAQEVIGDILDAGHKPNPLYYLGVGRVGCFPCIMVSHYEIWIMLEKEPDYAERLINAEQKVKRSFFPPDFIPVRYADLHDKSGKRFASAKRVFEYIRMKNAQGELYEDENKDRSCMTAFNICE